MYELLMSIRKSPTSIAMQVDKLSFQLCSDGVFENIHCGEEGIINHDVLMVGFGHNEDTDMNFLLE